MQSIDFTKEEISLILVMSTTAYKQLAKLDEDDLTEQVLNTTEAIIDKIKKHLGDNQNDNSQVPND
jgi:hypothetical protein